MKQVKKTIQAIQNILISDVQKTLHQYFKDLNNSSSNTNTLVLVQCVEDLYYFGLFGQIVSSLREKNTIRVEQFVLRSLRVGESNSFFSFLASRCVINPTHNFKWIRLYHSFCDGVGYKNTSFHPHADVIDFYRAWQVWKNLTDKTEFIRLQIDGVLVGDLINDSFLRFKPAPTVDLHDNYLLILIWQAYRDLRRAKAYFSQHKPLIYLTSYTTYTQHGIPTRVALQQGVRVFSFGNYQEFAKQLSLNDWVHTKKPDDYAKEFALLSHQDKKLVLAEAALAKRLSGGVDNATAYMKKSAYSQSDIPVPDVRDAVVIFLHDFYDSPHVYREIVFPDFWEWVCFTIETLKNANIPFFLKPHPNQVNLSGQVLDDLQQRYSGLAMIPAGVSNKQLAEAGMACAVTVYGTVAHEMAYLGIPTIASAHHPHICFDFCRTAKSRKEYAAFLKHPAQIGIDKSTMRQQSLMFYYMHNLNLTAEMAALRDAMMQFRMIGAHTSSEANLTEILQNMASLSGYQSCLEKMIAPND
jgi:DNA-binding protein Fis